MNGTHNNTSEITPGAYTKLGNALMPTYSRGCYCPPTEGKKSKISLQLPKISLQLLKCMKKGPAKALEVAGKAATTATAALNNIRSLFTR